MLENIEYLPFKSEFKIGDVKNLAVLADQKECLKNSFPKEVKNTISNADMLTQNFDVANSNVQTPNIEPVSNSVQVTSIPNIQNTFNMEANPVDLNVNPITATSPVNDINNIPSPQVEVAPNLNIPNIEPINSSVAVESPVNSMVRNINPIVNNNDVTAGSVQPIDNAFKVSSEPNIFDNMSNNQFSITQEELNKPLENSENETIGNEQNIFAQPADNSVENLSIGGKESNSQSNEHKDIVENSINDDIVLAQIAIEESNVKNYEALAENSKKKIELLKRQIKNKTESVNENINLENTASNLFNSNGILDDEKVLGKTPMPNIMAA